MANDDPVRDILRVIGRDLFDAFFSWESEEDESRFTRLGMPWLPGAFTSLREHPRYQALRDAILGDEQLAQFEESDRFVTSTTGSGSLIQPGSLPFTLLESAAASLGAQGGSRGDPKAFVEAIDETLAAFRALVAGSEADARSVIAFDGMTLRETSRIQTPWGVLRPADRIEAAEAHFGVVPTVVLTSQRRIRYYVSDGPREEPLFERHEEMERARRLLPLACILGIDRHEPIALGVAWSTTVLPGLSGRSRSGPVLRGRRAQHALFFREAPQPLTGGSPLSDLEEEDLREWAERVDQHYDPAIDIAIRRATTALLERTDAEDSLIDAIIALESLFGHGGTTEVGFRVTVALALLLESEPASRDMLRGQLNKIYKTRSTVVHGGPVEPRTLSEHKEQALETALRALRVLFTEKPHLIPLKDRGIRLIIGDHEPTAASGSTND